MSLEEFEPRDFNEREKGYIRMRSMMDLGMGLLWLGMGVFLTFIKYFNAGLQERFGDPAFKWLGIICIIYGAWRIYRGISKNYYRNR